MDFFIIWGIVIVLVLIAMVAVVLFLLSRIRKLGIVSRMAKGNRNKAGLISVAIFVVPCILLALVMGSLNTIMVCFHLCAIWIVLTIVQFLIRKLRRSTDSRDRTAVPALIITVIYMSVAAFLCFNVSEKQYSIPTAKEIGTLRIVLLSDAHVGTTFSGKELETYVGRINEYEPDIVVITGDFVDESTTREDMIDACAALGKLDTEYGTYLVFGNHDLSYRRADDGSGRSFADEELYSHLENNSVIVLEDEIVSPDDRFCIVGRRDRSADSFADAGRADMMTLTADLDTNKYIIVLDHQPGDYEAQAASPADLVLSGHTHGGQFFPLNFLGELMGATDFTYGHLRRDDTDFIVSSGIGDWALWFRTGCSSEFVIIDIEG